MSIEIHAGNRELLGGLPCLDFINTLGGRNRENSREWLLAYLDLTRWSVHAGTLVQPEADRLLALAGENPQYANEVLQKAILFREAMYEIFRAAMEHRTAASDQVALFNAVLGESLCHLGVATAVGGYSWDWQGKNDLEFVVWPVARSAAKLMTSPDLERIRQCPGCYWMFLDQSRNRSRTWCGMQWCGNRAKARRHYERRVISARAEGR